MQILKALLGHLTELAKAAGPPSEPIKPGALSVFLKRDGYQPTAVDLRPPRKVHTVGDVVSLCDYLGRHGVPGQTTVFCTAERFIAVIDDRTTEDGGVDRDWIDLVPEPSTAFEDWKGAFRKGVFTHVAFRNFLEDHKADVATKSMVAAVKGFAVDQNVEYSSDLNKGEAIVLKTRVERGQKTESGIVELDRSFEIEIPLLVGWEKTYRLEVRVEADLQGAGVRFAISPKNLTEVMHQLLNDQVAHLRETLGDGWLVVRGTPKLDRNADASLAKAPSGRGY